MLPMRKEMRKVFEFNLFVAPRVEAFLSRLYLESRSLGIKSIQVFFNNERPVLLDSTAYCNS